MNHRRTIPVSLNETLPDEARILAQVEAAASQSGWFKEAAIGYLNMQGTIQPLRARIRELEIALQNRHCQPALPETMTSAQEASQPEIELPASFLAAVRKARQAPLRLEDL